MEGEMFGVKAKIYPNMETVKEHLNNENPTEEELNNLISEIIKKTNKKLPNFKHIKSFMIMGEDFERTTTNKVKRYGKNIEDNK